MFAKQWYQLLLLAVMASMASFAAADAATVNLTLHDFMEDYVKPAGQLAKAGNEESVLRIYQVLPDLALAKDKAKWIKAIDKAVEAGNPNSGCRGCHTGNKRAYAKKHGDRMVAIPAELIVYLDKNRP